MSLVRRSADVADPPRRGADANRSGAGPALRTDRGTEHDRDPRAGGALPRRRVDGHRAVQLGRPADTADHGRDHGRGRVAAESRRARGDRRPGTARDGRVSREPHGHRRSERVRLAPHRRHRLPRRRRLPLRRRPRQGHDHHRRVQRVLGRGGTGVAGPSGGEGLGRHRAARSQMGRTSDGRRRTACGARRRHRGAHRLRQGTDRQRQGAEGGRDLDRAAAVQGRQDPEDRGPGRIQLTGSRPHPVPARPASTSVELGRVGTLGSRTPSLPEQGNPPARTAR